MPQACWPAAADASYWVDLALGNRDLPLMIDLGLVDAFHEIAFSLEPPLYDQMEQGGEFSQFITRPRVDASGRISIRVNGLITAQLVDPLSRQRIGPPVQRFVSRGSSGVPNRVGIVFFHDLHGCQVHWNLDRRLWCVEYP